MHFQTQKKLHSLFKALDCCFSSILKLEIIYAVYKSEKIKQKYVEC